MSGGLYWLAEDVVGRLDGVFEQTPAPARPGESYIMVESRLHADIYAALGSAAKIRALIEERPKRRNQSVEAYGLLIARTQSLLQLLQGLST